MSPMEWALVKRLLDEEIPLRVVLRAMRDTAKRGSTLLYYEPAIRAAVKTWVRGQTS